VCVEASFFRRKPQRCQLRVKVPVALKQQRCFPGNSHPEYPGLFNVREYADPFCSQGHCAGGTGCHFQGFFNVRSPALVDIPQELERQMNRLRPYPAHAQAFLAQLLLEAPGPVNYFPGQRYGNERPDAVTHLQPPGLTI